MYTLEAIMFTLEAFFILAINCNKNLVSNWTCPLKDARIEKLI